MSGSEASGGPPTAEPLRLFHHPGFAYFWSATTSRAFGGAIAGVAFQVLIVTIVNATPMPISILNALSGIQGRMNSTIRTVNRVAVFLGALLTGLLMTFLGYHLTIGIGAGISVIAALVIVFSPLRDARLHNF